MSWKSEIDVNDWVKRRFDSLGLKKNKDYNEESGMSDYLKEALKGGAKTKNKTNFGKPDFHIETYTVPVIIENKFGIKKLVKLSKGQVGHDDKMIGEYAANGALHYARCIIASGKYKEVIAIGVAGDSEQNVRCLVYYVFGFAPDTYKELAVTSLDFLENERTFDAFYHEAVLTEEEKHQILIQSRTDLQTQAKKLNKLMHNHNITAPQRVLYVSGMLLAMQGEDGIVPDDLAAKQISGERDGELIVRRIKNFLTKKS